MKIVFEHQQSMSIIWMFQVVDMRWGVRDEATDDHMTSYLCLNEIDNCQRLSLGPNFVVRFIFNKLVHIYRPKTHYLSYGRHFR